MAILFEYPVVTPTDSVTIKSPILGDSFLDITKVNVHIMMSAAVVTTKDTPTRQKFSMIFRDVPTVCDDQLQDLEDFLAVAKDNDVKLTDYDGNVWIGKIITDPLDIVYTHAARCNFALELYGYQVTDETYYLELESSTSFLLLESGGYLILESAP